MDPLKKQKGSDTCAPSANTMSPPAQDKSAHSVRKRVKGIECTLNDARSKGNRNYNANAIEEFLANLKKESPDVHAISVTCNKSNLSFIEIKFGQAPLGSVLSNLCGLLPPHFNVYHNIDDSGPVEHDNLYTSFPIVENSGTEMENYVPGVTEQKEIQVLEALKVNSEELKKAEESTRDQASNANWYYLREKRFTANLKNNIRQRNPKTTRGFQSFARSLVFGDEKIEER